MTEATALTNFGWIIVQGICGLFLGRATLLYIEIQLAFAYIGSYFKLQSLVMRSIIDTPKCVQYTKRSFFVATVLLGLASTICYIVCFSTVYDN